VYRKPTFSRALAPQFILLKSAFLSPQEERRALMPRYQHGALMTPQGMMPLASVAQPMMMATRPMVSVSNHNAAGGSIISTSAAFKQIWTIPLCETCCIRRNKQEIES
jgi:hypothetical protein